MPDLVASRRLRRRVPARGVWESVAWNAPERPGRLAADTRLGWLVAGAMAVGLGLGGFRAAMTESVPVREEAPVWMEMPPAPEAAAEPPPPPPPQAVPPPPEAAPAAPVPLEAVPTAAADPDPAFGLDDAVETGGLAVASGSTLAKEPDPVVRPPEPPAGPVQVAAVPASVRPVVPTYPPRAEEMGLEARVVAVVTTDTSGNVVDFRIERSGGREFDAAVRRAVLTTRFLVPRRGDGRAQAVAFRLPYDFRLE